MALRASPLLLLLLLLLLSATTTVSSVLRPHQQQHHRQQQEPEQRQNWADERDPGRGPIQQNQAQGLSDDGASPYELVPEGCLPLTLDAPMLNFVDDEPPRVIHNTGARPGLECQRIFECKVFSSPPEVNVLWYRNGKVVKATALRDSTLVSAPASMSSASSQEAATHRGGDQDIASSPMIGLSQMTHRICLDPYVRPGRRNAFHCSVESVCQPTLVIRSADIIVAEPQLSLRPLIRPNLNSKRNANAAAATTQTARAPDSTTAPLITMITSTRMELAGRDVQVACHASGSPRPRIAWSVIDDLNETVSYPIDDFPFIHKMSNGDIIVTSSKTTLASVTLRCEARNSFGADYDTSTIILLDQ